MISEDSGELIPNLRETFMLLTNNKVDIMLDEDTFKSTYDIMVELGSVWSTLTDKQRAYLAELSSGKTQANVFVSIMENIEDVEKAYVDSMNSQGSAMKEQEAYMGSLQAKINTLKESITAFWDSLVDSGAVSSVIEALTNIVNLTTKLVDVLGSFGSLGTVGIGAFAMFKPTMFKDMLTTFGETSKRIKLISTEMKTLSSTGTSATTAVKAGMAGITTSTTFATTAMTAFKTVMMSFGAMAVVGGISLLISSLAKFCDEMITTKEETQETVDTIKENMTSIGEEIKTIEGLSEPYKKLSQELGSMADFYGATTEKQKEYLSVSKELLQIVPSLATAYTSEGEAIVVAGQNLDEEIEKRERLLKIERESLAFQSTKLLSGKIITRDKSLEELESKAQELEKEKEILTNLEKGGNSDATNSIHIEYTKSKIAELSEELRILEIALNNSEGELSNTVKEILTGSEAFLNLDGSTQVAVQSLLGFNEKLAESPEKLTSVITGLDGVLSAFDTVDFSKVAFDEDIFNGVKTNLEQFLRTQGFADDSITNISNKIMTVYKTAWEQGKKAVAGNIDVTKVFNDELAKLGGSMLDHADNIIQLKTALKELDDNNALSASTLRNLVDQYPALIKAIGDEEAQRRILMGAVEEQEDLQSKVIENILELEKQAHIQKISMDEDWYSNKKDVVIAVLTDAKWGMEQELEACKSLADAKIKIDQEYAKQHAKLMKSLYNASMPKSVNLMEGTVNSGVIQGLEAQLQDPFIHEMKKTSIQQQISNLKQADEDFLSQSNALNSEYQKIIDSLDNIALEGLDLSGIGSNINSGLNKVNTPSSGSDKKPREEKEESATYNGNDLNKYANELERVIGLVDRYDKELEGLHAKKDRLHDKKMYEEELALIDEIIKKEGHRGTGYSNRKREVEANNKAILDEFKKQEGFTLSKFSESELDKLFNDKYGAKKEWKGKNADKDKEAWEAKAKNFQDLVKAYYDGVDAIGDLEDKLISTNDALVQLSVDKFQIQVELDDKKLKESSDAISDLSKSLEVLQTLGGDNLNQQVQVMAQIAGAETYQRQEMERQIVLLQQKLALLNQTDAEYQLIIDRVKELQDAQYDSYMNELRYRNEIKNKLMEQMELELEKQLYGSGGQQAWEDENNSKINALKDQLDLMKEQTDEKKKQEEAEKRALEIQKLRDKLENLKKQKTVQQLKQNSDGSWEWEYVADQEAISKIEQEIKDKEKEEEKREEEEEERKKQDEIQKEIDRLNEEAKIRREAYQRMINELKKQMDKQSNIFEMTGDDIQDIVNNTMDSLDKLYNGKFSGIIDSIRAQAGELSGIFEDARDEAEGWYDEAIKPPSSNNKPDKPSSGGGGSSDVPPTNKPDKTDDEKKAWHDNKDKIAKQMQANSKAWDKASPSERKKLEQENERLAKEIGAWKNSATGVWHIEVFNKKMPLYDSIGYRKFKTGGETQQTGLQWLDGEKGKPERVLSAEQTQAFNKMVSIMPDFLTKMQLFSNIAPNLSELMSKMVGSAPETIRHTGVTPIGSGNGQTVIVENIELPNVTDADTFRKEMGEFLNGKFSGLSQSAKVQKSK